MKEIRSLRDMNTDDLLLQESSLKESLFRLRFKQRLGDTESVKKISLERKRLARVKTLLKARSLGIEK